MAGRLTANRLTLSPKNGYLYGLIPANRMHRSALNPDSRWLRRTLLFVGFSFAWAFQSVRAAHYSGGSLTYQCLGGNQYLVTLDLFVDCSGVAPIPQTINFASDCGTSFSVANLPVPAGTEVSQLCAASIANSTCNGGALPGPDGRQSGCLR